MNVQASVARLPDNIRQMIAAHPSVSARLENGMPLHEVLSSAAWAEECAARMDELPRLVLKRLLLRFGSHAFGEEKGEAETAGGVQVTGAEWRTAMAFLRRCGIVFALRKTWGERLYYIPADMVPVWQRILLPVNGQPLSPEDIAEVVRVPGPPRLPLPLEVLGIWSLIRRTAICMTAKGTIAKPAAARLAAESRLTAEELAPLRLVYPQQDLVPPGVALALDLGLVTGVLRKGDKEIAASSAGLPEWMNQSMAEVNAEFYRLVMQRYASADPHLHLAASAAATLRTEAWYPDEVLTECGIDGRAAEDWLQLLAAFGWAERGKWKGSGWFRLSQDLAGLYGAPAPDAGQEEEHYFVQPDGEILVPPYTRMTERWGLEEVAERITADRMSVYRLTRKSCARAFEQGHTEQGLRRLLEQGSGASLPEPVSEAIRDWFRYFGRTRIVEDAVLLRTDSAETARRLLEDDEISGCLLEQIGERDFLADRGRLNALKKRLEYLGYDALASQSAGSKGETAGRDKNREGDSGKGKGWNLSSDSAGAPEWIIAQHGQLSIYRPDPAADTEEAIFPGLPRVPSSWLARPRFYHASTRRELIGQAIAWRTAVQVGEESSAALFVPQFLNVHGERWEVRGYWKQNVRGTEPECSFAPPDPITLTAEDAVQLKIVLPAFDGLR